MVAAEYIFYHLNASSSPEIAFLEQILKIKIYSQNMYPLAESECFLHFSFQV